MVIIIFLQSIADPSLTLQMVELHLMRHYLGLQLPIPVALDIGLLVMPLWFVRLVQLDHGQEVLVVLVCVVSMQIFIDPENYYKTKPLMLLYVICVHMGKCTHNLYNIIVVLIKIVFFSVPNAFT